MKIIIVTVSLLLSLTTLFGQGHHMHNKQKSESQLKEVVPEAFKHQLANVLGDYFILKDALIISNENQAEIAARKTLKALDAIDMTLLSGDDHIKWMDQQMAIKNNLNAIIQMKGIEMKRSHFSIVSDNLLAAIKDFGIEKQGDVYVEYCPMANNNNGGYWLSLDEEIQNPYFGDKMLKCGSVKAIL